MTLAKTEDLLGKTITNITGMEKGSDMIIIECSDGNKYKYYHGQDCCERVDIDDVCGDVADLIGTPLVMAEVVVNEDIPEGVDTKCFDEMYQWTFYKFATIKGYVTVRWFGESNGYYSVDVDMEKL